MSRAAVSQHLKVLKDAGLVIDEADGARRVYAVDPRGLAEIRSGLDRFWDPSLRAFKVEVERKPASTKRKVHRSTPCAQPSPTW